MSSGSNSFTGVPSGENGGTNNLANTNTPINKLFPTRIIE